MREKYQALAEELQGIEVTYPTPTSVVMNSADAAILQEKLEREYQEIAARLKRQDDEKAAKRALQSLNGLYEAFHDETSSTREGIEEEIQHPLSEAQEFILDLLKKGYSTRSEQTQLYRIFGKMGIGFIEAEGSRVKVVHAATGASITIHIGHGRAKENTLDPAAFKAMLRFAFEHSDIAKD